MTRRGVDPMSRAYLVALALLAYLPPLASAPGRVPGDTKLYLYLDPGRLVADSIWSWDARQLGGWVPHQNVGYLWPSGPFYAMFDFLGVPDWVAHRLWIGTLFFLAGTGVWWFARRLGTSPVVAMVAGLVYQTTPFVLPYVSRTSALLLPWALLGWITAVVVAFARRPSARLLGVFALLVATTGGLNATAVAMIAPAPLVWYLVERHDRGAKRLARDLAALAATTIVMSAWWIVGLVTQGRYGAAVLSYSEALPSTAATSTAPEILRGLGYWLLYDRNDVVPLTSAGAPYQGNLVVMAAGIAIVLAGFLGLRHAETRLRRATLTTLAVGLVLGVGATPFDDPSPLWRLAVDHPTSAVSLALRSSSRAAPLVVMSLAIGVGLLAQSLLDRSDTRRRRIAIGVVTVGLCLANLPALVGGRIVDPVMERPERLPTAWYDAARFLDDEFDAGRTGAVLLVPGIESAAYRWGYAVDPILPGLTKKPLVTRDWLPLGSAPYMDLLYALDDSFQNGDFDPSSLAPVARLLGADTVMVVNSHQFERFGTIRPERARQLLTERPPGLTKVAEFGTTTNEPRRVDDRYRDEVAALPTEALPEIELFSVDAAPVRVSDDATLFFGDGTGLVDAAAAGVIDGRGVLLAAGRAEPLVTAPSAVVVTDSNRRRAHHWRSSQEVWGATEPESGVLTTVDLFDRRLPVFPSESSELQTVLAAEEIEARATRYGTELSYWPEYRPSAALDGDPRTAWIVDGDARGETITVTSKGRPLSSLDFVRPRLASREVVARVSVRVDGGEWTRWTVTAEADTPDGQSVDLPTPGRRVEIRIDDVAAVDPDATRSMIGFAEVLPSDRRRPDVVRVPIVPPNLDAPTTYVFTRLTADEFDDWRQDPERSIRRRFGVTHPDDFAVRGSGRFGTPPSTDSASDDCRSDLVSIDDAPVPVRVTRVDGSRFEFVGCEAPIELAAGDHDLVSVGGSDDRVVVDRIVLGDDVRTSATTVDLVTSERGRRTYTIPSCPTGCWLETAEGWNVGWHVAGLDAPTATAAGRNLWRIETTAPTTFTATWTPQRAMWIGLAVSGLGTIAAIGCIVGRRRRSRANVSDAPAPAPGLTTRASLALAVVATALVVHPVWAVVPLVVALVARRFGTRRVLGTAGLGLVVLAFAFVLAQQIRTGAEPSFGWPSVFRRAHRPALVGVVLLAVSAWSRPPTGSVPPS